MKLYALTKRQFVMVFVVFFSCFGAFAIIGLAGELPLEFVLQKIC